MLRLDFSASDLNLPANREKTRRASISGVQDKVQLKRIRGGFAVVEFGGDYILKPVPRNTYAELAVDIPANEALTMSASAGSRMFIGPRRKSASESPLTFASSYVSPFQRGATTVALHLSSSRIKSERSISSGEAR